MSQTDFAISWIYDEFLAMRLGRGRVLDQWASAEPVADLAAFSQAMHSAAVALGMRRGGTVAVAYESDQHHHRFLDVPPLSPKLLRTHLDRRVAEEKPFDGPAVWGFHTDETSRASAGDAPGERSLLVHLMPRSLVSAMVRICEENHLTPRRILPLPDVVSHLVAHAGITGEGLQLAVAPFATRTVLVVTEPDGRARLVRELPLVAAEEHDRLCQEAKRTALFAKQRLHREVTHAWLLGPHAGALAPVVAAGAGLPAAPIDAALDPTVWAQTAARLPDGLTSNFIATISREITRRRMVRAAMWATLVLLLGTGALSGVDALFVERMAARGTSDDLPPLRVELERLQVEVEAAESTLSRARALRQRPPPIPALFLARLGELLPGTVRLSSVALSEAGTGWQFELEGEVRPPLTAAPHAVTALVRRLQSPPWNAATDDAWRTQWLSQVMHGGVARDTPWSFRLNGALR